MEILRKLQNLLENYSSMDKTEMDITTFNKVQESFTDIYDKIFDNDNTRKKYIAYEAIYKAFTPDMMFLAKDLQTAIGQEKFKKKLLEFINELITMHESFQKISPKQSITEYFLEKINSTYEKMDKTNSSLPNLVLIAKNIRSIFQNYDATIYNSKSDEELVDKVLNYINTQIPIIAQTEIDKKLSAIPDLIQNIKSEMGLSQTPNPSPGSTVSSPSSTVSSPGSTATGPTGSSGSPEAKRLKEDHPDHQKHPSPKQDHPDHQKHPSPKQDRKEAEAEAEAQRQQDEATRQAADAEEQRQADEANRQAADAEEQRRKDEEKAKAETNKDMQIKRYVKLYNDLKTDKVNMQKQIDELTSKLNSDKIDGLNDKITQLEKEINRLKSHTSKNPSVKVRKDLADEYIKLQQYQKNVDAYRAHLAINNMMYPNSTLRHRNIN